MRWIMRIECARQYRILVECQLLAGNAIYSSSVPFLDDLEDSTCISFSRGVQAVGLVTKFREHSVILSGSPNIGGAFL